MVKTYTGRKWDDYNSVTKGELYLAFVHFLKSPTGFVFKEDFKGSYINFLEKTIDRTISDNQYKGYVSQLRQMHLFEHESSDYGPGEFNRLYLNQRGMEFFFRYKNEILQHGKDKCLDLFLNTEIKKYIPDMFLNSIEN